MPLSQSATGIDRRGLFLSAAALAILATPFVAFSANAADDPLASWNDGTTKKSITDFVASVTKTGDADYVAPDDAPSNPQSGRRITLFTA